MSDTTGSVTASRHFDQPAERVFDAWLDPLIARRFLFATGTGEMVRAQTDPRVGGEFVFTDRRDGEDIEHAGKYAEITRPKRIAFDFVVLKYSTQSTRVTVDFRRYRDGTDVTLTQDGVVSGFEERTRHGWGTILAQLGAALS
ncbi:MAG: SRPBCC domain-containing protein [Gemmatimonadota bacterium]|nr:SRPBCC domain-containing protein [Gemmatimonadota bacterium]